jgi:hypothetical protein
MRKMLIGGVQLWLHLLKLVSWADLIWNTLILLGKLQCASPSLPWAQCGTNRLCGPVRVSPFNLYLHGDKVFLSGPLGASRKPTCFRVSWVFHGVPKDQPSQKHSLHTDSQCQFVLILFKETLAFILAPVSSQPCPSVSLRGSWPVVPSIAASLPSVHWDCYCFFWGWQQCLHKADVTLENLYNFDVAKITQQWYFQVCFSFFSQG